MAPDPADRDTQVEQERQERAQTLAIAQAVRDALVDRTLHEHTAHLEEINGSQRDMANSLAALEKANERATAATEALAKYVGEKQSFQLSRRTVWIGVLAVVAAYGTMLATLLASLPK